MLYIGRVNTYVVRNFWGHVEGRHHPEVGKVWQVPRQRLKEGHEEFGGYSAQYGNMAGGLGEKSDFVLREVPVVKVNALQGAPRHDNFSGLAGPYEVDEARDSCRGKSWKGGWVRGRGSVQLEALEGRRALEETRNVRVEWEGAGEGLETRKGCAADALGQDPTCAGIDEEIEGSELGHAGKRVGQGAIEGAEDGCFWVDSDRKGTHEAGKHGGPGEGHDDVQIVGRGGYIEVAIEQTLRSGVDVRGSAGEGDEVGLAEVVADGI